MMRVVLIVLLAFLAQPLWAQSNKDKDKEKEKKKDDVEVIDFDSKDEKKESAKSSKSSSKDKTPAKKEQTKAAPAKPAARPSYSARGKKPEPVTIVNFYHELPLGYLPPLKDFLKKANASGSTYKRKDNKEFREEFIRKADKERNFMQLQMPSEPSIARIKMFMPQEGKGKSVIAVETTTCEAACDNQIHFYRKDTGQWKEVTKEYLPEINKKDVIKRLESKYKEVYLDLVLFNERDFENPENFRKALIYTISPEEDKITVKEQYLSLPLYEILWDPEKSKFTLKKI